MINIELNSYCPKKINFTNEALGSILKKEIVINFSCNPLINDERIEKIAKERLKLIDLILK